MTLHVALQMDALDKINPATDSTLRLGLEAQSRGYEVWHYTPDKLFYKNGNLFADASHISLQDDTNDFYSVSETKACLLSDFDVIWLRQDPPYNMAYLTTCYMLERVHPKPFVVNNPTSIRSFPEKWFPTELAEFMPPTLISADPHTIRDFHREYKDVVIKPMYGHGGNGIFHLKNDDPNVTSLLETLFAKNNEPLVVQKFLPEMATGERRIILIDGELAAIAGRIPPEGETRAITRLGAKYVKAKATRRQLDICEALSPLLKERGFIYTGLDIIGDFLTEINITSPTSIPPINALYGLKLEADMWNAVESKLKS